MYTDLEASFAKDFTKALHLLHSSEPNSAEELLALLNASIAQRYGSGKAIQATDNSYFYCEEELRDVGEDSSSSSGLIGEKIEKTRRGAFTDSVGNDVGDKDEVPRISIPDEDQSDSLCKVCNVSEFGPLILIKCRKCGEFYHPLCHQPPVVDAQASDLRWECSECENQVKQDIKRESRHRSCKESSCSRKKR